MHGKKTRADNFNEEDKTLLLRLIANHISVLESRRTDHKNNSAKYRAWATISKKFHQQASHPRNFTQMKDLYRRLKLKAKKEVSAWLKACAESSTGLPPTGSQLIRPDDNGFFVYELIKPFKGELNPEVDEEQSMHERLLAEARKSIMMSELPTTVPDQHAMTDETTSFSDLDDTTQIAHANESETIAVKEELDFDLVHPSVLEQEPFARGPMDEALPTFSPTPLPCTPAPVPCTSISVPTPLKRRLQKIPLDAPPQARTSGQRVKHPTNGWNPIAPKRRQTFPSVDTRRGFRIPSSDFGSRRVGHWNASNGRSAFMQEQPLIDGSPSAREDEHSEPGMSAYEESMFQLAQAEHKAKMLVLQTQRRAETAKEEAYKMMWQNAQLQRDLLQMQYENVL